MQRLTEITWPADYIELKRIEELLSCGICYEYMKTPVMTPCSHNYCSLCIRRYLNFKTQCPKCFESVHDKDLCKNRDLDELIKCFSGLREKLAICIKDSGKRIVQKTETNSIDNSECKAASTPIRPARNNFTVKTPRTLTAAMKNDSPECSAEAPNINSLKNTPQRKVSSPSTSGSPKLSSIFTPKTKIAKDRPAGGSSEMVPCPVCSVPISALHINKHLDSCLKREKSPPKTTKEKRPLKPKLVCHLMKDKALRAKLKEYNLSTQGDRKALELRLRDYITLYNSECDKEDPRSDAELIKQLEEAENNRKESNDISFENRLRVSKKASSDEIEREHRRYLEMHQDSFAALIAKINSEMPRRSDGNSNTSTSIPDLGQFELQDSDSNTSCPLLRYASHDPSTFVTVQMRNDSDESPKNDSVTTWNGKKTSHKNDDYKFGDSSNDMLELECASTENNRPDIPFRVTPDDVLEMKSPASSESNNFYLPEKGFSGSSSLANNVGLVEENISDDIFDASTDGSLTDPGSRFDDFLKDKKLIKKRSNQCTDSESDLEEVRAPAGRKMKKQKQREKKGKVLAREIAKDFMFDLSGSDSLLQGDDEPKVDETEKKISLAASASSYEVPHCSKQDKENTDSPIIKCISIARRSSRKRSHASFSESTETVKKTRSVRKLKKVLDEKNDNSDRAIDDMSSNGVKLKSERGRGRPKRKSVVLDKSDELPKRTLRKRTKD